MSKLKRILALICTINMLFGNLSLDSFVIAESPTAATGDPSAMVVAEVPSTEEAKEPEQAAPKVEAIDNPMDQVPTASMSVGESRQITLDTVLTLNVSSGQKLALIVDGPVNATVTGNGSSSSYAYTKDTKTLEALFEAAPGSYEVTFSSNKDMSAITVRVVDAMSYLAEKTKDKSDKKDKKEEKSEKKEQKEEKTSHNQRLYSHLFLGIEGKRVKDGRPSSEAAGRGNRESSVGTDDSVDPVCIAGNLGVVANVTSQNTPF